jgi:hypothetical protein
MNIYSHIIIADEVVAAIKPGDLADYYWGAVIPDIRYLTGIQREKSHLSSEQLAELAWRYPQFTDFLAGYRVHCLADQFDLVGTIRKIFPFALLKQQLTPQHYPVILELYHIRHRKREGIALAGIHNPILAELGISEEQTLAFGRAVQTYIAAPSFLAAIQLSQQLRLVQNNQVGKYLAAAQRFQSNPVLTNLLFLGLTLARIDRRITRSVLKRFPIK